MKKYGLFLILLTAPFSVFGVNDPFSKTQRQGETPSVAAGGLSCYTAQPLAAHTPFEQLQFVGTLIGTRRALWFLDEKQQLFSAAEQDFIGKEGLQVQHIALHQIRFNDWRAATHCGAPTQLEVKF